MTSGFDTAACLELGSKQNWCSYNDILNTWFRYWGQSVIDNEED